MRLSLVAVIRVAGATALAGLSVVGCTSHSKSSTAPSGSTTSTVAGGSSASSSAQAQQTDYTPLLIQATDINAPEPFTATPPRQNPDGKAGVATTFSSQNGAHVISDTILILSDPSAAGSALESAKGTLGTSVQGMPGPSDVGTGGPRSPVTHRTAPSR